MATNRFSVAAVFSAVDKVTAPVNRMQNSVLKFSRRAEAGLRSVDKAMGKITGSMTKGITRIAKWGGAAAAAGVAMTVVAMNKAADRADNLAKTTARLKFPIEAFQEWQFVAQQSGMDTAIFDKGLEKFTRTIGEAKVGTGALTTMLKKSNPELLKQLGRTENSADAFDIFVQAMRETTDQSVKLAMAQAAFGRAGAKFVNVADTSADAVAALRKEQRENGIITAEQAAAAEAYNDALNSLKQSFTGVLQGALLPMMPAATHYIRLLRQWIVENKALIQGKFLEFVRAARDALFQLWERIVEYNRTHDIISQATRAFEGMVKVIGFLIEHGQKILIVAASIYGLAAAVKIAKIGMIAFNFVVGLNPILLIAAGILSAGAAIGYFISQIEIVDRLVGKLLEKLPALGKLGDIAAKFMVKEDTDAKSRADEQVARLNEIRANKKRQVISPAQQTAAQMSEHTERSVVDVNFNNAPAGTEIKQSGAVPGVNTRVGFSGAY
jgi:hypothetical protein